MAEQSALSPLTCIVDFHHAKGPVIERWVGVEDDQNPVFTNDWSVLPFLALPDGSHSADEELSYFTLFYKNPPENQQNEAHQPTSLFGISCTRHIKADQLLHRDPSVTRSSVQKAVVAIVDSPYLFARIRERLSAVTKAWFDQKDFRDVKIIEHFKESLVQTAQQDDRDEYFGMSLRELVYRYKYQTLVLFKCFLLQPKMLFFGTNCEKLCLLQFALISLIPGLLRSLQDCADPNLNSYEETLVMPSSLRTSDRASLLSYMGLPLQIFGKGSLFGPYTPLQQLDVLADSISFIAGSTNSLLLHQKLTYSDVFIHLDDHTITMSSPQLKSALVLTVADRRFIDFVTKTVVDTWDDQNPTRPSTHGFTGSEDFIRLQFEEYLLALLSSVKYRSFVEKNGTAPKALLSEAYGEPVNEFGVTWVQAWTKTENYRIFNKFTDENLFDVVEPRHPTAGALSVEDIQRRVAQQVSDLHLDERFNSGKEALGKHFATGQKKVSSAFNTFWADIEVMREAQRKKGQDRKTSAGSVGAESVSSEGKDSQAVDVASAQAQVQAAASRAGAYLSSWGAWAAEKRRAGWNRSTSPNPDVSRSSTDTDEQRPRVTTVSELDQDTELEIVNLDDKFKQDPNVSSK